MFLKTDIRREPEVLAVRGRGGVFVPVRFVQELLARGISPADERTRRILFRLGSGYRLAAGRFSLMKVEWDTLDMFSYPVTEVLGRSVGQAGRVPLTFDAIVPFLLQVSPEDFGKAGRFVFMHEPWRWESECPDFVLALTVRAGGERKIFYHLSIVEVGKILDTWFDTCALFGVR